jgi:hypothetical protein
MAAKSITKLALTICCAGVLLHLYTAMFRAEGGVNAFLIGLVLLSCSPYVIAAALALTSRGKLLGLGGAAVSFIADIYMHYSVFVAPKGSTAALGLLAMPIWNLLAIGPAGAVLLWIGFKLFARNHKASIQPMTPGKKDRRDEKNANSGS